MQRIGIMQGRVIPERSDILQMFPISNWKEELRETKKIGFEYVELLFDKDLACKKLLLDSKSVISLGIRSRDTGVVPIVSSVCVDYLSSISAEKEKQVFCAAIANIIGLVRSTTIEVLVIPFFDENVLESPEQFETVLDGLAESGLDEVAKANNVLLALELGLPATQIRTASKRHRFKNIGICYDLGNAKAMGYSPENEIIELSELICHVHIKDRGVNGPNVMLGEGDVDFRACFTSLEKTGYRGMMILETTYTNSPIYDAARNLRFVNDLLAGIRA